jgi:hypothetical protein
VVVVVAAVDFAGIGAWGGEFDGGGASEFAAPDDQGFVEQPALFEVLEQGADGLVAFAGEAAVIDFEVVVIVPGLAGAVPDLDEADAAFDEASGDEDLPGLLALAVHGPDGFGFARDIEGIGRLHCMR